MRRARRVSRGQALVETALGVTVTGAVLLAAIHFSEVGFIALKVQEAGADALWNSTRGGAGHRVHQWPKNFPTNTVPYDLTPGMVALSVLEVQGRYSDFDGRLAAPGAPVFQLTDQAGLTVNCQMDAAPVAGLGVSQRINDWAGTTVPEVYMDNGGLSCSAEATVNANAVFPRQFFDLADPGGRFATSISVAAATALKVCALGRPSGGNCTAKFNMMLDDWSGQNADETDQHIILPNPATSIGPAAAIVRNERYKEAAERFYDASSNRVGIPTLPSAGAGSAMAIATVGWTPVSIGYPGFSESSFFLSSSGEPTFYQPPMPAIYQWPVPALSLRHLRIGGYSTTPGGVPPVGSMAAYSAVYFVRDGCFLGRVCN